MSGPYFTSEDSMTPKMGIFDCDGVLVDSETIGNKVLQRNLARHGLELSLEKIMDMFVGGTTAGLMGEARKMGADLPDDWLDHIYPEIFEALTQSVEMVPHIPLVLDALDVAGIVYAIGSNGPMRKMEITLGKTNLWDRFEGRAFSSHDCDAPKPAPDVYLKAARLAGVDPGECVVIEDSANGAQAAVAAKMPCYGYCAETPIDKLSPYCVSTFDDMRDLPKFLGI